MKKQNHEILVPGILNLWLFSCVIAGFAESEIQHRRERKRCKTPRKALEKKLEELLVK